MDMILKNTFQSISPAYELIGDVTVGSNTTQVDFTGLNIGKDDELLLVAFVEGGASINQHLYLYFNANTTDTAYYIQRLSVDGTSVSGARVNSSFFSTIKGSAAQKMLINAKIKLTQGGYVVTQSSGICEFPSSSYTMLRDVYGTSTFNSTEITTLTLKAGATNAILTGSRFQLYKLVAEKVADIIVPSNTTSVDITGLDIGKGNEYYLASDTTASADCTFYLTPNGNDTLTNYYNQLLVATGTTVAGSRTNSPVLVSNNPSEKSLGHINIKLTNSGYYVAQNSITRGYGGSGVQLTKINTTSTATMSSITSLKATASTTNGIGANSRFTLYKMK